MRAGEFLRYRASNREVLGCGSPVTTGKCSGRRKQGKGVWVDLRRVLVNHVDGSGSGSTELGRLGGGRVSFTSDEQPALALTTAMSLDFWNCFSMSGISQFCYVA